MPLLDSEPMTTADRAAIRENVGEWNPFDGDLAARQAFVWHVTDRREIRITDLIEDDWSLTATEQEALAATIGTGPLLKL